MKLIQIINSKPVLESLLQKEMPGKLAYAIAKNIRRVDPELDAIDRARDRMLADNWPLDPVAQVYIVPPEDQQKWNDMYLSFLQEQESDVVPYLIDPALFDGVSVTPQQLLSIEWMLKPEPPTGGDKPDAKDSA